ncbi:MAG: hypothetical protein ACRDQ6_01765, partial [Pseudonocardiaceae bacterium]
SAGPAPGAIVNTADTFPQATRYYADGDVAAVAGRLSSAGLDSLDERKIGEVSALPGPVFVYPVNGQTLGYKGSILFKVQPVDGASGYLYGFFQDGKAVWENYHDEHTLSGTEYGIAPDSPGHNAINPGSLQVWVRALVNGQWTEATVINIHLDPAEDKNNVDPGSGNNADPSAGGGDGQIPFACITGPNDTPNRFCPKPDPATSGHMTWNDYLTYLQNYAENVDQLDSAVSCGQTNAKDVAGCLGYAVEKYPALAAVISGAGCAIGAAAPEAIVAIRSCITVGNWVLGGIIVAIRQAAKYDGALNDFLNTNID